MAWYNPLSWFKPQTAMTFEVGAGMTPQQTTEAYKKMGLASAGSAFMQGIVRRTKPVAETTSSAASLSEYLKSQALQYPSTQYTPSVQTANQPVLDAMQNKITPGGITPPTLPAPPAPVKEAVKTAPETPRFYPSEGPREVKYEQKMTRKGVYMIRTDEEGQQTTTFLRENRPGDIIENEIYTWQNEWRPLSTEYQQGKGEMYFAPPREQFSNLIKNQ